MALMENSLCKYFYSSGCDFNNFLRLFPAPCKMFQIFVQNFSSLVHVCFFFFFFHFLFRGDTFKTSSA